jgi:hypothetical protein
MPSLITVPLLLALFPALPAPVWSASEAGDASGARHLALTAENAGEQQPVRLGPHPLTGRVFDTPLRPGGVEVAGERRVEVAVNAAEGMVTLLPSGGSPPPDGPRPSGITDLFDARLLSEGRGVVMRNLINDVTQRPDEMLGVKKAWSYRAELWSLVAVELRVLNTSSLPWTADGVEGAELVSTQGVRLRVVRVWQPQPIEPGQLAQLVVEAEATVEQLQGTFLLKLGEAGGPRTLTVRGVSFP